MGSNPVSEWKINEALTRLIGSKPKSQSITMGIQSLGIDSICEMAASQVKSGIRDENYPLTEEILSKILSEICGVSPDKARNRAAAVFGK